jgi:outer membrane protein assembly factor BamB
MLWEYLYVEKGAYMRKRHYFKLAAIAAVILVGAGTVFGQDWPQWRGTNRDAKVTGFEAPATWPESLNQKWSVSVGAGDATPALVGDKVYAFTRQGDEEVIMCLEAADGKEVWKVTYATGAVTGPAARHPGPRSSPTVADGKVVTLGVNGVVSCVDAGSGEMVWQKDPFPGVVPRFFTSMSPLVVDGMAVAFVGGPGNGALMAFDLASGDEKWRWDAEGPDYGSPVVVTVAGTKQIVAPTEKSVVGVAAADGKLLWQMPYAPGRRAYNAATPVVEGETIIYSGKGRGTTAVKIEKADAGFATKELWTNPDLAVQYDTPVLVEGHLYGLSDGGQLFCIDAENGATAWVDETERDRGGFGAIVSAGSCLMAMPSSAELIVYKPSAEKFEELATIKVSETATYTYPVIAGNRIFIKDQDSLTLWTLD